MSLLSDFMARTEIDALGEDLAKQFVKRLPVARSTDRKRIATESEVTLGHARGIVRARNLGTYGKSRLANSYQWALIDEGYEKPLAMELGTLLATRLAERVPKQAAA